MRVREHVEASVEITRVDTDARVAVGRPNNVQVVRPAGERPKPLLRAEQQRVGHMVATAAAAELVSAIVQRVARARRGDHGHIEVQRHGRRDGQDGGHIGRRQRASEDELPTRHGGRPAGRRARHRR